MLDLDHVWWGVENSGFFPTWLKEASFFNRATCWVGWTTQQRALIDWPRHQPLLVSPPALPSPPLGTSDDLPTIKFSITVLAGVAKSPPNTNQWGIISVGREQEGNVPALCQTNFLTGAAVTWRGGRKEHWWKKLGGGGEWGPSLFQAVNCNYPGFWDVIISQSQSKHPRGNCTVKDSMALKINYDSSVHYCCRSVCIFTLKAPAWGSWNHPAVTFPAKLSA